MQLPKDPYILLSFINLKLRDAYHSLDELSEGLDCSLEEIIEPLRKAGYSYDEKTNSFKPVK